MPLFSSRSRKPRNRHRQQTLRRQLRAELLEERRLLAADPATLPVEFRVLEFETTGNDELTEAILYTELSEPFLRGGDDFQNRSHWRADRDSLTISKIGNTPNVSAPEEHNDQLIMNADGDLIAIAKDGSSDVITLGSNLWGENVLSGPDESEFYFVGTDDFGRELWKSDGSENSAVRVTDLAPGSDSGVNYNSPLAFLGQEVYFAGSQGNGPRGLWKSDGTSAGTSLVTEEAFPIQILSVDDYLIFLGNQDSGGSGQFGGLYRSDGTDSGTELIRGNTYESSVRNLFAYGENTYFTVHTLQYGRAEHYQLYKLEDPQADPELVFDSTSLHESLDPTGLNVVSWDRPVPFKDGFVVWENVRERPGSWPQQDRLIYYPSSGDLPREIFNTGIRGSRDSLGWSDLSIIGGQIVFSIKSFSGDRPTAFWTVNEEPDSSREIPAPDLLGGVFGTLVDAQGKLYVLTGQSRTLRTVVAKPTAYAGPDAVLQEGGTLLLDGSGSRDLEDAIVSFDWDFDYDGNTFDIDASGVETSISAPDGPDSRTVALRVTDRWGNVSIADKSIAVQNVAPTIAGIEDASTTLGIPLTISANISDPGDDTLSIVWDLGNGSILNDVTSVTEVYSEEGEYFGSVTATDSDGASTVKPFRVVVGPAVELVESMAELSEELNGAGEIEVRFVDDIVLGTDVVVPLTFSGAASQNDFVLFQDATLTVPQEADTITISSGERSGKIYLQVVNDTTDEDDELLTIEVGIPSNASLGNAIQDSWTLIDDDPMPDVYLSSGSRQVAEDSGAIPVVATLSQVSEKDVVVNLAYAGSATMGEDYDTPVTEIVIPAGQIESGTSIFIADDNIGESVEQIRVSIVSANNATPSGEIETHLIAANDSPTIRFASVLENASESNSEHRVRVVLSNPSDDSVSAQIGYAGTAEIDTDYRVENVDPFSVTFDPGQTTTDLVFTIVNDDETEDDESINLSLSSIQNALPGGTLLHQTSVIDDDSRRVTISLVGGDIWENDSEFLIEARLSKPSDVAVEVPITVTGTLDEGTGYLLGSDRILIPAGEVSGAGFVAVVLLADDKTPESDERLVIRAAEPANATLDGPGIIGVTIKDNDPYVQLEASSAYTRIDEGDSQSVRVLLTDVNGNNVRVNQDVTVDIGFTSSQADRYDASVPSFVTIPAGQSAASFEVLATNDGTFEATESFRVKIESVDYGSPAPASSLLSRSFSILDNDSPPRVYWRFSGGTFSEGSTVLIPFSARLGRAAETTVRASLTFGGSATEDSDFSLLGSPTITFEPGEVRKTILIGILDDRIYEGLETIDLNLSTDGNWPATFTLLLNDNESKPRKEEKRKWYEKAGDYLQQNVVEPLGLDPKSLFSSQLSTERLVEDLKDLDPTTVDWANVDWRDIFGAINVCVTGLIENPLPIGEDPSLCITGEQVLDVVDFLAPLTEGKLPEPLQVQHGYVREATVFIDENFDEQLGFVDKNGNGIQELGEHSEREVTTDYAGSATLGLPLVLDKNANGILESAEFQYVSVGGVDISTDFAIDVPLVAPVGYSIISPLSTLVAKLRQLNGDNVPLAEERVVDALGLPGTEFLNADLISIADAGSNLAAEAFSKSTQVFSTALQVASFSAGLVNSVEVPMNGSLVTLDMAEKILADGSRLDLTNEFVTESILRGVISRAGASLPANDVISSAAVVIANSNRALNDARGQTGREYVEEIVRVQKVTEGAAAQQLRVLAAGAITPSDISSAYSVDAIETLASTAQIGNVVIPGIIADDVTVTEGPNGTQVAVFEVGLTSASNLPVTVDFATSDVTAHSGEDYTATSGQLTWAAGDTSVKSVQVTISGDSDPENDERFHLLLTDPVNAAVLGTIAYGDIINDDARTLTTSDDTSDHALQLEVTDSYTRIFDNGTIVFEGSPGDAELTIEAVPEVHTHLNIRIGLEDATPTKGLNFLGSGANSSLSIDPSFATSIERIEFGNGDGRFLVDGVTINYEDVANIDSPSSPTLSGLVDGDPKYGDTISVTGQLPSSFNSSIPNTEAWSVLIDGIEQQTIEGDTVNLVADQIGIYQVRYTATQDGRLPTVATYEFEITDAPPIANDDVYSVSEDLTLSPVPAEGLFANDADPEGSALTLAAINGRSVAYTAPFEFASAAINSTNSPVHLSLNASNYYGVRFEVTETIDVDRVGGNFGFSSGTGPFAAVVELDGPNDLPDSVDLSTPDVIATTVVPLAFQDDGDKRGDLDIVLQPGWYAIMFGTGKFGSNGNTRLFVQNDPVSSNTDFVHARVAVPEFFPVTSANPTRNSRFVIEGTQAAGPTQFTLDSGAMVTATKDGSFTYDPRGIFDHLAAGSSASEEFIYTVTDPSGLAAEAVVSITIDGANDAPVAADDSYVVSEQSLLRPATSVGIFANDVDTDGSRLALIEVDGLAVTQVPRFDFASAEPDPQLSASSISLNDTNYYGVRFEVTEAVQIDRLGASLQYAGGSGPFAAIVALDDENDYPDSLNLQGSDLVTTTVIRVDPGHQGDAFADVNVTLQAGWYSLVLGSGDFNSTGVTNMLLNNQPVGDPSVFHDAIGLGEFRPGLPLYQKLRFIVEGTAAGKETSINLVSGATVEARSNGRFTYDPREAFDGLTTGEVGTDSFTYSTIDEGGATSTATVAITINGWNDAPELTANSANVEVNEGTLATLAGSLFDPEGDVTLNASLGSVVLDEPTGNWTWRYETLRSMPTQTITITATDDNGSEGILEFELTVLHVPQVELLLASDSGSINERDEFVLTGSYRDSHGELSHQVQVDWDDPSITPLSFDLPVLSSISTGDQFVDATGTATLTIDSSTKLTEPDEIILQEINSTGSSSPFSFFDAGDYSLFVADDGINGFELWRYDASGPHLIKDINPSERSIFAPEFTQLGNDVFFVANDGSNGFALWKTDGTASGTTMVFDARTTGFSQMKDLVAFDDQLFFSALDESGSQRLWRSDGTQAGTSSVPLADLDATRLINIGELSVVGDRLFLRANQLSFFGATREELFAVDDATADIRLVKDIFPGNTASWPSRITDVDGIAYFQIQNASGANELWKSDGTEAGTVSVSEIVAGGVASGQGLLSMTAINGLLLFGADDGIHGTELWRSDGTDAGTFMVTDINPVGDGFTEFDVGAPGMAVLGDRVYFQGIGGVGSNNRELWYSDGTAAGTASIEIRPGSPGSEPRQFTVLQDAVYFVARDATHGFELWKSDGTGAGTRLVQDRIAGSGGLRPAAIAAWDESLLISGYNGANDNELYIYQPPETIGFEVEFSVAHTYDDDRNATAENQKQIGVTVTDFYGGSVTSSTSLKVVNVAPLTSDDQATITEGGGPILIAVLTNDSDVAGTLDPLTLDSVDVSGSLGEVNIQGNEILYSPAGQFEFLDAGQDAQDVFAYAISDDDGGESIGIVTITIQGEADPPQASDDNFVVTEDMPLSQVTTNGLLANDVDPDNTILSVSKINGEVLNGVITLPSGATLQAAPDGSFSYDPVVAFDSLPDEVSATDTFTYTVSDASGLTDTATVEITIVGRNDLATISDAISEDISEDTDFVAGELTVEDVDEGEAGFQEQNSTAGSFGTFSISSDGSWLYDLDNAAIQYLNAGDTEFDSFQVFSIDGFSKESVEFRILGGDDTDTDGVDDSVEEGIGDGNGDGVLDSEQDNVASLPNAVTATNVTLATPDGIELVNVIASDSQVLDVSTPANVQFPIGLLQFTALVDVGSAADVRLFYDSVEPANAIYKFDEASGYYQFHDVEFGIDSFGNNYVDLHLVDGGAGDADGIANGLIVDPVGLALIPGLGDDFEATNEDEALTFNPFANDVLAESASIDSVSTPAFGTADANAEGTITYLPNPNFFGEDSFEYTVSESNGVVGTATVYVTVLPVNDEPSISINSANSTVKEGDEATASGTFTDIDPGTTLHLAASIGEVSDNGDGTWSWSHTPTDGPAGSQLVVVSVDDGVTTSTVDITLTVENVPVSFEVGNDASLIPDDEGDLLRTGIPFMDPGEDSWSGTVSYGDGTGEQTLQIDSVGKTFDLTHTYTTEGNFTVTVRLKDDDSDFITDSLQVSVILNQPPIADEDSIAISEDDSVIDITGNLGVPGSGLLGNDSDPDGDEVTIVGVDDSRMIRGNLTLDDGIVSFDPNGEFDWLAAGEFSLLDFTYTIADPSGETSTANATIVVEGANDAPYVTANLLQVTIDEGQTAENTGKFADLDDSDNMQLIASIGQVASGADGTWTWSWDSQDGPTDSQLVAIDVSDGTASTSIEFQLDVSNVAPTPSIDAISDVRVEGTEIVVDGSATDPAGSNDTLTYGYEVLKDGVDYASGSGIDLTTFSFTPDDNDSYEVRLTVSDEDGGATTVSKTIAVGNVLPELVSLTTDSSSVSSPSEDLSISLSGSFADAGTLDTHSVIVSWGDGTTTTATVDQAADTISASHEYLTGGVFEISATLTDNDGGSVVGTTSAAVQGVGLVGSTLYVVGTEERDRIELERKWKYDGSGWWWDSNNWFEVIEVDARLDRDRIDSEFVKANVDSVEIYSLGGHDHIEVGRHLHLPTLVHSGDGDDRVEVSSGAASVLAGAGHDRVETGNADDFVDGGPGNDRIETGAGADVVVDLIGHNRVETDDGDDHVTLGPGNDRVELGDGDDVAWLGGGDDRAEGDDGDDVIFGQAGDDRIDGDRGNDVIVGGEGDDRIDGDRGFDVLIGGLGADRIDGGRDDDLLIAGWTSYDDHLQALQRVLMEWSSEQSYDSRVQNMRSGSGDTLAGTRLAAGETVFDDGAEDRLDGDHGRDWFFGSLEDEIKRRRSNELLDLL